MIAFVKRFARSAALLGPLLGLLGVTVWSGLGGSGEPRAAGWQGMSTAGAPDILLLGGDSRGGQWMASWNPHRALEEIQETVQRDSVRRILERHARNLAPMEIDGLADMLVAEGREARIDPLFLAALIRVESAFSKDAISDKGARGLMQVMPATGREVAESLGLAWSHADQLHDAGFNVRLGVSYLGRLLALYRGNYRFALTAYNRGPHSVRAIMARHGSLGEEYTEYFRKIQETYRTYLRSLGASAAVLGHLG
jgi:hypothetical protein